MAQDEQHESLLDTIRFGPVLDDSSPFPGFDILGKVPLFYMDKRGGIVGFNRAFAEFWGGEAADSSVGGTPGILLQETGLFRGDADAGLLSGTREFVSHVSLLKRKGFPHAYHRISKALLRDENGEITGIVGVVSDAPESGGEPPVTGGSEERYRAIFEYTGMALIIVEENGLISMANQKMEELVGFRHEEIVGRMKWVEFVAPEDLARLSGYRSARLGHGASQRQPPGWYEVSLVDRYGKKKIVSMTVALIPGTKASICSMIDVSGIKSIESELRRSEEYHRAILQNSFDVVTIHGPGGLISDVTSSALRVLGYPPEEMRGRDPIEFIHPDDRAVALKALQEVCENRHDGEPTEFRFLHADGSWIYLESMAVNLLEHPEIRGLVVNSRDITWRKRTEEELRESEEKYRSIFENAVEGIFQCLPDGRLLSVNPSLARMFGYDSPGEMITSLVSIENHPYVNREDGKRIRQMLLRHTAIENFTTELYKKDGMKMWISLNARAVPDGQGKIVCCEGTIEDITERKNLEAQLIQVQKIEAVGQLAGGIAHDFNNILSIVIGAASILRMKMEDDDPYANYVDQILSAGERATHLTKSLLAFGRKQVVDLKILNLNSVVVKAEKMLSRLITEDIRLDTEIHNEPLMTMADQVQMEQILINLVTNARDAITGKGVISMQTGIVEMGEDFIRTHGFGQAGRYGVISVRDNGKGMTADVLRRIFDPFYTTKEVGKGTGLGLSIVYGIVKQHNGYVVAESEIDRGTIFTIYLPLAETAVEDGEDKGMDIPKGGVETILIAEDDKMVRALVRDILESYGYGVIEATNGDEALSILGKRSDEIDLLILDVVMPGKNGKEVYDEAILIKPGIKAVFCSGYTDEVVLEKGVREEDLHFITKPVTPKFLLDTVREVLDLRS